MKRQFRELGWRLLPGGITALVVASLTALEAWQPLEQIAYNTLFQLRGAIAWDSRVVVVGIDDQSLRELGPFPWPRQQYVQLLSVLSEAEPNVIALNVVLTDQGPQDTQLAAAVQRQGRVILAQAWNSTGEPLLPSLPLRRVAFAVGQVYKRQDSDGLTRKIDLQVQGVPAFGLAAVQGYSLVQASVELPNLQQPFWVNWPGPVRQLQHYSFVDVVQQQVPTQAFKDKIVVVGMTAAGLDSLPTPFDRNPPASGTHLHAAVISNLLQHNSLRLLPRSWLIWLFLLGGPGLSYVMSHWSTERQIGLWLGLCCAWGMAGLLLLHLGYLIPVVLPIILFSATAGTVLIEERLRENALLQHEVQQLWQAHHQDLVQDVVARTASPTEAKRSHWQPLHQPASMQHVAQLALLAEQFGRSQSAQAAIARSLSIGLLAADLDGLVWFCNPGAAKWLGIQVGDRLHAQLIPQWLSQEQWQLDLQLLRQQQPVAPRELLQDGTWFELKLEPLLYNSAETAAETAIERQAAPLGGLLLILEDITARKQIEENLSHQMEELQRMSLLKDDFLSTVSHELRSPMANMKMAIYMLKIAKTQEQEDHYFRILQAECDREISLINDLLDLQRLEAAAKPFNPETIDLNDWLPRLVEPFEERASNRQQTIQVQILSELPLLVSDQPSLERVLAELLNNACKYTPPGGEISAIARFESPYIELSVSNSGSEIPEVELTRIFEKFYRIPRNDRWKQGGTGLGLALVKKLVEHLGGGIRVASSIEQTTFTVSLPTQFSPPDL
ncbi:MAG: CHASE2 domain-containing protein [Trichocoleus desertorum ATA4-8-CV12]|jgi:signal transduction histidine kinase/CHASE2 domain-containing sensor protein|nr:CHASE2 domain-containing protein [Trichocoleus desertorum ATA4-8-CV12]